MQIEYIFFGPKQGFGAQGKKQLILCKTVLLVWSTLAIAPEIMQKHEWRPSEKQGNYEQVKHGWTQGNDQSIEKVMKRGMHNSWV